MWLTRVGRTALTSVANRFGYDLAPTRPLRGLPEDASSDEAEVVRAVRGLTLTSPGAILTLTRLVERTVAAGIPGDIVECGVWRGGSMAAVARTLRRINAPRDLWLYDTFEVFKRETDDAKDVFWNGVTATLRGQQEGDNWGGVPVEQVRQALTGTGYDPARLHFVQGYVENTIPQWAPDRIALLRLDTDFYESTRHELRHLYPRLSSGGVLIVDDYGVWKGSRIATDEYFSEIGIRYPPLIRFEAGPVAMFKS